MPKLQEAVRGDRIMAILDAAERCFARSGFHGASMSEICAEAQMSPGNLYRYFRSKEALTEGLIERDLAEGAERFAALANADDIWQAFGEIGRYYLLDRPREELAVWVETMAETARNPTVGALRRSADCRIRDHIRDVLILAKQRGQASPDADVDVIVEFLLTYADGLLLRRVKEPDFDAHRQMESLFAMTRTMMGAPAGASNDN